MFCVRQRKFARRFARTLLAGAAAAQCSVLAAAEAPNPSDPDPQDTVIVTGQREKTGETGTKTNTPLIELPQTVTVIDNEELTRRNALSINQALTYVAGVTPNQRGNVATRYDQLFLRGFSPGVFLDGMRFLGGIYSAPQIDFHLVERVDVIKGPASVLYGSSTPGGLVNLTSKVPYAGRGGRIELAGGNYDLLRSVIDVNQPLDGDNRWLTRVIAGAERSDGFIDLTENSRYYVRPMLTFAPDAATSITLILNYQRDPEAASYSGVPVFGSALPNPFGPLPVDLNVSEPEYEVFDRKQKSATLLFRRDLSDALSWSTSARYLDVDLAYRQIYLSFGTLTGTGANRNTDFRSITRGGGGADERFRTITVDSHLVGEFSTGPFRHTLLAGVDWQNNRGRNEQQFLTGETSNPVTSIPNLDLYAPVYGRSLPSFPLTQTRNFRKIDQVGLYLQDQIAWGGLQLIASGRWDNYEQLTQNRNLPIGDPRAITRLSQDAFTMRLGALYEFDFGLAPFASYSESFEPQAGVTLVIDAQGQVVGSEPNIPVTGRQYEAGAKFQPRGTDALFTLSAFDLRRQNVPVPDPRAGTGAIPAGSTIQVGEVKVRGLELDGRGDLAPGLSVIVAGSYTDAEVVRGTPVVGTGDQLSGVTGTRPLGVPKWGASGFLAYDLAKTGAQGPLSGVNAGAGVRYVGESDGTTQYVANGQTVTLRFDSPGFVLVDAVLGYDFGRIDDRYSGLSLAVNAANLFNKRHVASCFFNNSCYFGASRTVQGTIRYAW